MPHSRFEIVFAICALMQTGTAMHTARASVGPFLRAVGPVLFVVCVNGGVSEYADSYDAAVAFVGVVGDDRAVEAWRKAAA